MAAKICADIKPTGLTQGNLCDLLHSIFTSIDGICSKLDDDGGVPLETYEANVKGALWSGLIENTKGSSKSQYITPTSTLPEPVFLTPRGLDIHGSRELIDALYMIVDGLETLCEQLDADALTDDTYEALCYTATILYLITNSKSQTVGNGNEFTFHLGAAPQKQLIDLLYGIVHSIELLTAQLDGDGTVNDTDYTALWYTNTITLTVENSQGQRTGN